MMNSFFPRQQCALWALLLLLGIFPGRATAQQTTNDVGEIEPATELLSQNSSALRLANRTIFIFRGDLDDFSPEERCAAAQIRLQSVLSKAKTVLVSTQEVSAGIQIRLDDKPLFVVTPTDVASIQGETLPMAASQCAGELRRAIHELNALSSGRELLKAFGWAALLTAVFAGLAWLARKISSWLQIRATRLAAVKTENVMSRELRRIGLKNFVAVIRVAFNLGSWLFIAFLAYTWMVQVMRCFPYLRPWGEFLHKRIISAELTIGRDVLLALPGILVVVLIILAARMLTQIVASLFSTVENGEVTSPWLDINTASTTRRIVILGIWVCAIIVAYPYIPGSNSLAFKGITVFLGLLFSLGSSSLISQVASGLLLIYSRAFRAGDYVRFGEIEGTILQVGVTSTYIRTVKNEEVHVANSVLVNGATKNYTRLAETHDLLLPTKVTIGYNTPWRQVEAMLIEAARRTEGLLPDPAPFVNQTALSDFYVEYELNAHLGEPAQRMAVLSRLHANIQDVFNENSVQIMSPHYLDDPAKPHIVPKSDWYLPPAKTDNRPS